MARLSKTNIAKEAFKKAVENNFDYILEAFLKKVVESKVKNTILKLNSDLMAVLKGINQEIIDQLMNIQSPKTLRAKVDEFMKVPYHVTFYWRYLSHKWVRRKKNRIFFFHTGTLKNRIAAMDFSKKLGVFVYFEKELNSKDKGNIRKIGKVVVRPMNNVKSVQVKQAIVEGKFDKNITVQNWLAGPTKERMKLLGPKRVHRPLVIPVLHYYINYVIPKRVRKELSKWL